LRIGSFFSLNEMKRKNEDGSHNRHNNNAKWQCKVLTMEWEKRKLGGRGILEEKTHQTIIFHRCGAR